SDSFRADLRLFTSQLETQALYYNIRSPLAEPFPGAHPSIGHGAGDRHSVNDTSGEVRVNNPGVNERDLSNISLKLDWDYASGTLTSITSFDKVEELLTGDGWDFLPIDESATKLFYGADQNQSQFLDVDAWSQEIRFTSPSEERLRWITGVYGLSTHRFTSTGNIDGKCVVQG